MPKWDSCILKRIALSPERSGGREAGLSCSRHYLSPAQPGHQGHSSSMVMFMNMRKIMMSMIMIMMSLKILRKEKMKKKVKKCLFPGILEEKVLQKGLLWNAKYQNNFEDSFEVSSTINEDLSWSIIQLPARH